MYKRQVLGIVGLGRIGSEVARRCRAMGMKIIAYDPYISAEQAEKIGVTMVPLEEVYRRSDFISLHLPLNNATYHLIGDEQLAMMKPVSYTHLDVYKRQVLLRSGWIIAESAADHRDTIS